MEERADNSAHSAPKECAIEQHPPATADVDEATAQCRIKVAANVHEVDIDPARRLPQPGCSCKFRPSDHPSPSTFEHREKGRFPIAQPDGFAATGRRRTRRSTCGRRTPGFTHELDASFGLFLRGCGCVSAALRLGLPAQSHGDLDTDCHARDAAFADAGVTPTLRVVLGGPGSHAVARGRGRRRHARLVPGRRSAA